LKGTGIGLAIAQWIVQQHTGSITVQSLPGKGSIFFVELPLQVAKMESFKLSSAVFTT
jgi:signal transduction histidine kinase